MVYRIYVEKKKELANEAAGLKADARTLLGVDRLTDVRVINRYDVENIDEALFEDCRWKVFAEPQLDNTASSIEELTGLYLDDNGTAFEDEERETRAAFVFAVEALPGQFDQRADSAEQCIQIISRGERPMVRFARVYVLYGELMPADRDVIMNYVINPVETREASLGMPETLVVNYDIPTEVKTLNGFIEMNEAQIRGTIKEMGLAMDEADLAFCVEYFRDTEHRDPTITELKVIDTYWSDHCRHTTFNTVIDSVTFEDPLLEKAYKDYLVIRKDLGRDKPVTLMDIGTIAARYLKRQGMLDKLDESEEVNACTVRINVDVDGESEPWLLLFKNETHNHPTEIEPFGGAATCLGGCIRDPLSGRAYAYSAMRLTGAADPLQPVSDTMPGKLPQRVITTAAAKGYSSYGNQIGLCTGMVDEVYHPGYAAKRMEVGAVMAATPSVNVRRERPAPGDVVLLLGGSTGRDGIGGATGSSKAHDTHSVETCGAEVQKGNAPEERKIQRLFRNGVATRMIKRCNDFGAGGVSVAIGELADGLNIDLDAVPKKYEGLDGTELAISESQERMACVIDAENEKLFKLLASEENLQCVKVAEVTEEKRLVMHWNGKDIVNISREFLDTNGADKHIDIAPSAPEDWKATSMYGRQRSFTAGMHKVASDLNTCSKRGLSERFDSTIGAGTVLMPFGGINQITPIQAMVHKIPLEKGETDDCSLMAWGYNPYVSSASPYHGAYLAVIESVSKLIATGASFSDVYLTFQEYFESPRREPDRWGKPLAALLGAFEAQLALGVASIGGKDSMSGTFENIDVPPALISFAVTTAKTGDIVSPEFKEAGHRVVLLSPYCDEEGTGPGKGQPQGASLRRMWEKVTDAFRSGSAVAAYTPGIGGVAEAVMKMCYGNGIGFAFEAMDLEDVFGYSYGSILLEVTDDFEATARQFGIELIGHTTSEQTITFGAESVSLAEMLTLYEGTLESVFPTIAGGKTAPVENLEYRARSWHPAVYKRSEPKVLIPVFPGTNCEYDSARAIREAGGNPQIMVMKNRTSEEIKISVESFASALKDAQMVFIPGGFSGGDEPDGSAKFITAFFRNEAVKEGVMEMLDKKDGLMCGVCNGFQA
ncbi:MAG: phosphoribosylformylglycinamidine synthase, partial [Mogibacterium sp.]|nr:phosphoribosylformylglycinamidine synthase [Mogibacterium sp.]